MGKLNEKAMLIKVELKKWGGTKTDKSLAEEISDNHSTDSSLYSVSKKLTKNATLKAKKLMVKLELIAFIQGLDIEAFVLHGIIVETISYLLMQKIGLRKGLLNIEMIVKN